MPIVAKSELTARAAAKAAMPGSAALRLDIAPPARTRRVPAQSAGDILAPVAQEKPRRKRGHATKNDEGKWVPPHDRGFAAPPVEHRFRKGGPGGPGRPKGSKSHDTLLKTQLSRTRNVRIDGRDRVMSTHELMLASEVNLALKGDRQARKILLAEAQHLYREQNETDTTRGGDEQLHPTATDTAILDWFMADVLQRQQNRPDGDVGAADEPGEADDG